MASAWERMQQKAKEEQAGRRETAAPAAVASNSAWERMQQKAAASVSSRGGAEPKTRSAQADEILEKYGVSREQRDAGVRESYAKRSALSDYADEFLPDSGADFVRRMGYNAERAAAAALGAGEAVTDFLGTTLYTGVEKVASLGGLAPNALSEWSGKAADKFLDNSISEQYKQNIKERYNPSVGEEKWGNLTEAGAQMATAIATGKAAASAVGKASSGVTALLDKADDAARAAKYSKGAFGLQAAGGATNEAHDEGATRGQALTYGAAVGAMETAIESIAGGIPGMGKGKIGEIARKVVSNPTVGKILDTLGEGGEEALSTIVTPFIKRAVYNENAAAATADEIAESAIMGILLSGIAQGGAAVAGRVAGTAQEAPPNAAAQRTGQSDGVDMAESESPAQAAARASAQAVPSRAQDALVESIVRSLQPVTNKQAEAILADADSVAQLGIDTNGMTRSQQRAAVKDRVAQLQLEMPAEQAGAALTSYDAHDNDVARGEPARFLADISRPEVKSEPAGSTVGAAAAGFETPGSQSVERTSRLAETATPYTGREGEATARTREEYDRMFQYMSQTEEQSQQAAQNMLYLLVDGQPTFLMDYDPEGYQAITDSLRLAPAWNGVMTDAAMLIKRELMGRSINGEISEDTYVDWLQTMREHATASGQGVQAWAKWSRTDNGAGQSTELDAWEALEGSALSEEERQQRFQAIVMFDRRIEAAQTDADLKQIILDIARQRGTLSGLTGRQSRVLTGLASSALDGLNTAQLRQFAYSSSAALSTDATASNAGQKIKTIQILNMLSNPKTPAKNLAGNTSFYTLDAMTMRGAALLDMALSKITGTRSVAMEGSVLGRESREAISRAIRMSLAEVTMDVDMGGDSRYQQGGRRTFKAGGTGVLNTNTTLDRFAERVLSAIERNMGYLMTTTDEAYKGAARSTQQATQRLVDAGKVVNAGRDYAENQAEQLALYRTFQNDGKVAAVIRGVHDLLNIVGVGDSGRQMGGQTIHSFGLGDLVAPFTRVAGNLASVGMDYSPVNAVKGTVEILDTVRRAAGGRMDPARQAKAVSDFARGMSGSAIAYGVMVLAKAGLIKRAEDEEDEDIASLNQTEGMMGTQVNIDAARRWIEGGDQKWIPGDTLIDMSNLEPLNFIVSLGVELADNPADSFLSTFWDVNTYKDAVGSAAATAGDLPILSSAGDFATDVLVYHNDPMEAGAEMLGKTAISSVTPNILAAFAKGWDDKQRSTYSGEGVQDVLVDTLKSRIPGLREQLPTVVNSLGEEKDNPGTLQERLLNAMLNPIGVNEYSQSAVSQEMERVREETGETGFYPSKSTPGEISATKGGKNKTVELSFEQRQDFQRNRGALTMVTMSALIGKSAYRNADDATKSELLSDAQSYAYQAAKARLMGTEWVDKWVKGTIEAQKSTGLDPATVITYRDMLSRAKESGTTSEANQKVRQTIMADTSMTASQKAALDNIVISDGVYIPKEVNVDYSSNESFVITQMSDGAQGRWKGIKAQFGMDAATYQKAWSIYQDDDLKADQKRQKLSELGYNGPALYTALGKKIS